MLELIPSGTKIPFMKFKWPMAIFSIAVTFLSLWYVATRGFNYGVDFAGGIELVIRLPKSTEPSAQKLREILANIGVQDASVQEFGDQAGKAHSEFIVHFASDMTDEAMVGAHIEEALKPFSAKGEKLVSQFRFTGLEKAYLTLAKPLAFNDLSKTVKKIPFGLLELTDFAPFGSESSNEYQLTFQSVSGLIQRELQKNFAGASIEKLDFVGAKVGKDLKLSALLSLLIATLLIFIYIFIRFDLVYAPGVVLSLIHDVSITAGIFAYLRLDFDLTIVAALLTLAGYSINDTIIVYDRIREAAKIYKGKGFEEIINISANQTLSRTIITSGTVFLTTFALWMWGGPVIHNFAVALLVGVVVGTYSSVFVAAPAILFSTWLKDRDTKVKKAA